MLTKVEIDWRLIESQIRNQARTQVSNEIEQSRAVRGLVWDITMANIEEQVWAELLADMSKTMLTSLKMRTPVRGDQDWFQARDHTYQDLFSQIRAQIKSKIMPRVMWGDIRPRFVLWSGPLPNQRIKAQLFDNIVRSRSHLFASQ